MKKREPKYIRDFKAKISKEVAQKTRKRKREEFSNALAKEKVENYGDIFALFCGLSKRAKDHAVLARIEMLARMGYSPADIIEKMEPEKKAKKEKTDGRFQKRPPSGGGRTTPAWG